MPDGVALVGFDDNPLSDRVAPWLSSMRVPSPEFGPEIWAALAGVWNGEAPEAPEAVLAHRLVIRDQNTGRA